jgi:hypothetical protein
VESGLLDVVGDELWIHDWALYNGDLAARVAAYCEKFPQASANDVLRFTGGNRGTVLELVREYRSGGSTSGTSGTSRAVDKAAPDVAQSGTAGGTGPQPHRALEEPSVSPRARARGASDGLTELRPDEELQRLRAAAAADDEGGPFG